MAPAFEIVPGLACSVSPPQVSAVLSSCAGVERLPDRVLQLPRAARVCPVGLSVAEPSSLPRALPALVPENSFSSRGCVPLKQVQKHMHVVRR